MNVLFRVDSSDVLGVGHTMRCLTLAKELRTRGATSVFASKALAGNISPKVRDEGFEVLELNGDREEDPKPLRDLAAARRPRFDLLVVDHYGIDGSYEAKVRDLFPKIFVIDDLVNRRHDCDGLLDQTHGRQADDYVPFVPKGARILTGTGFALLREEFQTLRSQALKDRPKRGKIERILVAFGGGSSAKYVKDVLAAFNLLKEAKGLQVKTVLGQSEIAQVDPADYENLKVTVLPFGEGIAQHLFDADLAVGACGTMSWERGALGLPTLAMVVADNQRDIARELEKFGAIDLVGDQGRIDPKKLAAAVQRVLPWTDHYQRLMTRSFELCDALGAQRVAKEIEGTICKA